MYAQLAPSGSRRAYTVEGVERHDFRSAFDARSSTAQLNFSRSSYLVVLLLQERQQQGLDFSFSSIEDVKQSA